MFYLHIISNLSCALALFGAGVFWAFTSWRMSAEVDTRKARIGLRAFAIVQFVVFTSMATYPALSAFDPGNCVTRCESVSIAR